MHFFGRSRNAAEPRNGVEGGELASWRNDALRVNGTGSAPSANVLARNEGRDIWNEGPQISRDAAKWCSSLEGALDIWGDVSFNFESTDTADHVATATASA